jgi:hypothetical protein
VGAVDGAFVGIYHLLGVVWLSCRFEVHVGWWGWLLRFHLRWFVDGGALDRVGGFELGFGRCGRWCWRGFRLESLKERG